MPNSSPLVGRGITAPDLPLGAVALAPPIALALTRRTGQSALMEYAELERRLGLLGELLRDRLSDEQRQWFTEFLNAGEYGIALEMLADWLCEDDRRVTAAERAEAKRLAQAMGNVERVMGPLALCPK